MDILYYWVSKCLNTFWVPMRIFIGYLLLEIFSHQYTGILFGGLRVNKYYFDKHQDFQV